MISYYWVPSLDEFQRMMCYKLLEVTYPSLTPNCTSMCNGNSCNTHSLHKSLLVKNRWCLASTSWMTSTSSSSAFHLHMSNGSLEKKNQLVMHMPLLIHFIIFRLFFRTPKVMFLTLVFHIQSTMYVIHAITIK